MKNTVTIESVIAANRFGLGARGNELSKINPAPKTWLLDQLQGPSRTPAVIASLPDSADVLVKVDELRQQRKQMRENEPEKAADNKNFGKIVRRYYMQQTGARYLSAATSDYPFHERLVHFWSNYFAVSADKQPLPAVAGLFEKEAIRPYISGKFSDLLLVTEFGRTVRVNGTRGTDHGTAGAAMLLGGAINGGKIQTDWPGLKTSALYQGRDLKPTTDLRSIFKGVLADHLSIPKSKLDSVVFPASKDAPAKENLCTAHPI